MSITFEDELYTWLLLWSTAAQLEMFFFIDLSNIYPSSWQLRLCGGLIFSLFLKPKSIRLNKICCPTGASRIHGCALVPQVCEVAEEPIICKVFDVTATWHKRSSSITERIREIYIYIYIKHKGKEILITQNTNIILRRISFILKKNCWNVFSKIIMPWGVLYRIC